MTSHEPEAVLITGTFGCGKSATGAEMADMLEKLGVRYALLDLDYLAWGYPGSDDDDEHLMMLKNLVPVVRNYADVGVRRFILAGSIRTPAEFDSLRTALAMPLRIVRLDLPARVIESRLASDPTTGRRDDFRRALAWIAAGEAVGLEDVVVSTEPPVQEVAAQILGWLAWR